jgi:hypothetical protein
VAHCPFVLAGDLSSDDLNRWCSATIEPAARALAQSYFDTPPDDVITMLLFSGKASCDRYTDLLFGERDISIFGYYKPGRRTLVINIATGSGTLLHELTHALAAFDFPAMPPWLSEGLASLHEQCRFQPGPHGLWLEGLANWRLPVLQDEIRRRQLPSITALAAEDDFQRRAAVNYAHARYFCMFLQQRGLLAEFYRRFRANRDADPRGLQTLAELFPNRSWAELDAEFQEWALRL